MQDLTLLEMAWEEVLELDVTVSVTDLAKVHTFVIMIVL